MYYIGIDIGGTNLKMGLIKDAKIIDKITISTDKNDVFGQVVNTIYKLLESNKLSITDIKKIGIGCPGIVLNGVVLESANLGLKNFDFKTNLERILNIETIVLNDADMATLAEYKLGGGKSAKNMILLTLGTGVGGGIIIDGKLYFGNGGAGELGHVTMYKDGIPCNCGRKGCAEKYLSALALSRRAKEELEHFPESIIKNDKIIRASDLVKYYEMGDECAKKVVDEYVCDLSEYVQNLCNIFRPDIILIGGGVSYAPKIIELTANLCKEHAYGYLNSPKVDIKTAKLGNDAGIYGVLAVL